jgi:hypothetical protein
MTSQLTPLLAAALVEDRLRAAERRRVDRARPLRRRPLRAVFPPLRRRVPAPTAS